ncbi:MAG: alpha/beta hydrolase [Verrucomicrobia bacterium]|nr:alpha/beta hydrolase [Verrucomicrobiota bacterium]
MYSRLLEAARLAGVPVPAVPPDDAAAGELAAAVFLRPARTRRPAREDAYLAAARRCGLPSPEGELAAWTWGDAGRPLVVLVHGWEGRGSQLGALAAPLAAAGLCVLAFDAPAHGDSPGREASVPQIARILAGLTAAWGPVRAIVGHSMGAAAAGVATDMGLRVERMVFLAPPLWQRGRLAYIADRMQLPAAAQPAFFAAVERRTDWPLERSDLRVVARAAPCPLLVFHDPGDADTEFVGSEELVRLWAGARLVPCPGRGHNRILTTPAVIEETVRFVAAPR